MVVDGVSCTILSSTVEVTSSTMPISIANRRNKKSSIVKQVVTSSASATLEVAATQKPKKFSSNWSTKNPRDKKKKFNGGTIFSKY